MLEWERRTKLRPASQESGDGLCADCGLPTLGAWGIAGREGYRKRGLVLQVCWLDCLREGREWEEVFSSLLFGWRVGMFFVEERNAQSGEDERFDLLVVDCKGCGARGIVKRGLWGRVAGCRRWAEL